MNTTIPPPTTDRPLSSPTSSPPIPPCCIAPITSIIYPWPPPAPKGLSYERAIKFHRYLARYTLTIMLIHAYLELTTWGMDKVRRARNHMPDHNM